MTQRHASHITMCPACEGMVQLSGKIHIGQKLPCRQCGSTLAVFNRKPLELILANESHSDNGRTKGHKNVKKNVAAGQYAKNQVAKRQKQYWAFDDDAYDAADAADNYEN